MFTHKDVEKFHIKLLTVEKLHCIMKENLT